jgi:putative Holliday junction resolvase
MQGLSHYLAIMARYIAFDWGRARTGIAVTDSAAIIASPHCTVPTGELHAEVSKLALSEPCKGFVVGMPGLVIGSQTDSTQGIKSFVTHLESKHPEIPVHLVDESSTSVQAMDAMLAGGMKKSKRREKGSLDKVAAAIILQRFMETL